MVGAIMTGLYALISGAITGALPDVLKWFAKRQDHKHEIEFLRLQHELMMERERAGLENKLREAESAVIAEEIRATREHLVAIVEAQSRPTGIAWIDGFNALLRPTACSVVIALFVWVSVLYVGGVTGQYITGKITVMEFAQVVWGSMVGESIVAVLGFLFGYRGARKAAMT